jgi:adenylyltransferase/sulfurtransferase
MNTQKAVSLTEVEKERYLRQLSMEDWSEQDQLMLKNLHVTVLGIGGAASSIINNLLLLGVGTIQAFDSDVVELSNLNRQFLHNENQVGRSKARSLKTYAKKLNSNVTVKSKQVRIDENTIEDTLDPSTDILIDTFDKWAFRFIVNRFAVKHQLPYLLAGVVSNCFYTAMLHSPQTPCLSCLLGRFQSRSILGTFRTTLFPINILPLAALGAFSLAQLLKFVKSQKTTNNFYFGSLYETKQDIRFFSLFLSKHFRNTSREQGIVWETEWQNEGIRKITISKDPSCRVCGKR